MTYATHGCPGHALKRSKFLILNEKGYDFLSGGSFAAGLDETVHGVLVSYWLPMKIVAPIRIKMHGSDSVDESVNLGRCDGEASSLKEIVELRY